MVNIPKRNGTTAETAVVNYAVRRGFPQARRITLQGSSDRGDALLDDRFFGMRGGQVIAEVKSTKRDLQVGPWMRELTEEVGHWPDPARTTGILVAKYKGAGTKSVGRWFAAMPLRWYRELPGRAGLVDIPPWWRGFVNGSDGFVRRELGDPRRLDVDMRRIRNMGYGPIPLWCKSTAVAGEIVMGSLHDILATLWLAGFGDHDSQNQSTSI